MDVELLSGMEVKIEPRLVVRDIVKGKTAQDVKV
jgi:hypothetical protein